MKIFKCYSLNPFSDQFYLFILNRVDHQVAHVCNLYSRENGNASESREHIQLIWISSEFIMRAIRVCWKLLDPASLVTDLEPVIQKVVKIIDAFLYMQGEISF